MCTIKYKITKKGNFYYVYHKFLLFWWYSETFSCLENAEKYINQQKLQEIKIKKL